jgi:protein TonB
MLTPKRPLTSAYCSEWKHYGDQVRKRSRAYAAVGMCGVFSIMTALCMFHTETVLNIPPLPKRIVMYMENLPPPSPAASKEPEVKKILAEDSEFLIPQEPPPIPEPVTELVPEPVKTPSPKPIVERTDPPQTAKKREIRPKKKTPPPQHTSSHVEEPTASAVIAAPVPAAVANQPAEQHKKASALAAILQAVEKYKRYPKAGRRSGAEGKCGLMVRIDAHGKVYACELAEKSGKSVLDAASELLGEKLIGLDTGTSEAMNILIPVHYSLTDR